MSYRKWLTTLTLLSASTLSAQPHQPSVIAGEASFSELETKSGRIAATDRTIINWNSFSIAADEALKIDLPSSKAALLNRVTGKEISHLLGRLDSNGKIYLINPHGIIIGKEGVIKTAGFLASTLDLTNEEFLNSDSWTLQGEGADILNLGTIETTAGELILIGKNVRNEGSAISNGGNTHLAAGTTVVLKFKETPTLSIELSDDAKNTLINSGHVESIQTNPYTLAIEHEDQPIKLVESGGRLFITAAYVDNSGTLKASQAIHQQTERGINTGSIDAKEAIHITGDKIYNAGPLQAQEIKIELTGPYIE